MTLISQSLPNGLGSTLQGGKTGKIHLLISMSFDHVNHIIIRSFRISLRVELYGCDYIPDVLHFNGTALIRRDLSRHPVASLRDIFRFRFKTNKENGIILYSRGSQGDYIALQLIENRFVTFIGSGLKKIP